MREIIERLGSIWLKEVDERRYAWVRVAFGVVVMVSILYQWPYGAGLYSASGVIDQGVARSEDPGVYWSVFALMASPAAVAAVFLLGAAAAVMLVAGVWARAAVVVVYVFVASTLQRAPLAATGWDHLLSNFAFILIFSPLGERWGPGRLWVGRRMPAGSGEVAPRYGLVLLQIQVAVIYWQAVSDRWNDPFWRDGEFLTYFMLSHHGRFAGAWVLEWHDMFEMLTHLTVLLELALPILLWVPKTRVLGICLGVAFHAGIAVMSVNIAIFSLTMVMSYVAFLGGVREREEEDSEGGVR